MKIIIYKGAEILVYINQFEIWRNGNMIAEFIYNRKKPLMPQIKQAMEM